MDGKLQSFYRLVGVILLPLMIFVFFDPTKARAQQDPAKDASDRKLVEKVKEEVMKELREGDFLREQIQLGIQDYLKKQKEAQVAAQAEQLRAATEKIKNVRRVSERDPCLRQSQSTRVADRILRF